MPDPTRQRSPSKSFTPGPSNLSNSGILRAANVSPSKGRAGSLSDLRNASPTVSPKKPLPGSRKGSIWDSFFQYDITYQGGKPKK